MAIEFDSVDMRDVDTLAWLIDNIEEPSYSKAIRIIQDNGDFDDFKKFYIIHNGSPFIERKTVQVSRTFVKIFDEDEPWTGTKDKQIDIESYENPRQCVKVNSLNNEDINSFEAHENYVEIIMKEIDFSYEFEVEKENVMDIDNDCNSVDKSNFDETEARTLRILNSDSDFVTSESLRRLEKDFPQRMRRMKRLSRWAPVLMNRSLKVGEKRKSCSTYLVDEFRGISSNGEDDAVSTQQDEEISPSQKFKSNIECEDTVDLFERIQFKRKKLDGKTFYFEADINKVRILVIEAGYQVKRFDNLSYCQHHRFGRFHFLSDCEQEQKFIYYMNRIRKALIDGEYSFVDTPG